MSPLMKKPVPWTSTRTAGTSPLASYGRALALHPDGDRFAAMALQAIGPQQRRAGSCLCSTPSKNSDRRQSQHVRRSVFPKAFTTKDTKDTMASFSKASCPLCPLWWLRSSENHLSQGLALTIPFAKFTGQQSPSTLQVIDARLSSQAPSGIEQSTRDAPATLPPSPDSHPSPRR